MEIKHVVTSFLQRDGKVLILRRSERVGTYQGRWAGISGFLETAEDPLRRALTEIREEAGLSEEEVSLLRRGDPFPAMDERRDIVWYVHPFLFESRKTEIVTDWEHVEARWIEPEEIYKFETVPKLPETLARVLEKGREYADLDQEIVSRIEAMKLDRVHGASWLGREALQILRLAAERTHAESPQVFLAELKSLARVMMKVRPSMASLTNSVGQFVHGVIEQSEKGLDLAALRRLVMDETKRVTDASEKAVLAVAQRVQQLVPSGCVVLTHSYSSTVREAFRALKASGTEFRAIVTESRPLFEGRRLAKELSELGVPTTLIVDSAVGYMMAEADMVLVGADSVLADGSVVNKVGTCLVAMAASREGKAFYVACEESKFDVRSLLGEPVIIEEKDPSEILAEEPLLGVTARNIYFDVTPAKYVTGLVTERGVIKADGVRARLESMIRRIYL